MVQRKSWCYSHVNHWRCQTFFNTAVLTGPPKILGLHNKIKSHKWIPGFLLCSCVQAIWKLRKRVEESPTVILSILIFVFIVTNYDVHRLIAVQLTFWVPQKSCFNGLCICIWNPCLFFFKQAVFFLKKTNMQLDLQCIYCKETNIYWEQTYSCFKKHGTTYVKCSFDCCCCCCLVRGEFS